jgi:hypothetical protein
MWENLRFEGVQILGRLNKFYIFQFKSRNVDRRIAHYKIKGNLTLANIFQYFYLRENPNYFLVTSYSSKVEQFLVIGLPTISTIFEGDVN